MTDQKTKLFFKLLRKNDRLFGALLKNKASKGDAQMVAFCLTELYFRSQHLVRLIKKISEANLNFTEGDLDSLLGKLVDLRIEIYDEMTDWIKHLKKPLRIAIDKIADLGAEKYGWE